MNKLDAALEYVALGWPVLPVGGDNGKKPLIKNGVSAASADPDQVRAWWTRWPDANVAIATGAPGPDVLDVDEPEQADDRVYADGLLHRTFVVATQRGHHYYFVGTDQRTVKLPYGELRRKGSYVMAPPSVRPDTGHVYDVVAGDFAEPLPPEPEWLTEGRSTAGTGVAEPVERVAPGDMYDHLLDLSVRLARAGLLDGAQRERILVDEFDRVRIPGAAYGGDRADTRRLADAPLDILEREADARRPSDALPLPPVGGSGQGLEFRTLSQIWDDEAEEPSWIWEGNVAEGFITVVGGRPKVGKSTITYEAINRLVRGDDEFMGGRLTPTDVVVVSEEHAVTARRKFSGPTDRVHLLTREAAWPLPEWRKLLGAALAEAKRTEARLLLVDSFTFWAGLSGEAGQDAGFVQSAMNALVAVAREGIGVMLIHHQRKAGGEFGDALLGSTVFAANADNIMEVERVEDAPAHYRRINRVGRWFVPPVLIAAWQPEGGYSLVAEAESNEAAEEFIWTERIRAALRPYGKTVRQTDLSDALGADSRRWGRAMAQLLADGEVRKAGAGIQRDPFTFTSVAPEDRPDVPAI